jgi:hypothetical protein
MLGVGMVVSVVGDVLGVFSSLLAFLQHFAGLVVFLVW